jgi:hypothetical protein
MKIQFYRAASKFFLSYTNQPVKAVYGNKRY